MAKSKTKALSVQSIPGEIMPEEFTYAAKLRSAVYNGITEADIADVVKTITRQAKAGDETSIKLLFDYVLGNASAPTSVVVHNHFKDVEQAARIVKATCTDADEED